MHDLRTVRAPGVRATPFAALRTLSPVPALDAVPGLPPFQGGAAGYLAYDWGLALERLPAPRYDDLGCPTLCSASTTGCWRGTTTRRGRG